MYIYIYSIERIDHYIIRCYWLIGRNNTPHDIERYLMKIFQ